MATSRPVQTDGSGLTPESVAGVTKERKIDPHTCSPGTGLRARPQDVSPGDQAWGLTLDVPRQDQRALAHRFRRRVRSALMPDFAEQSRRKTSPA